MAKRIFIDIETLPPGEEERDLIGRELQATLDAERNPPLGMEEALEERFRELALQAEKGRLLTIGLIIEENGRLIQQGLLGRDRSTGRFHLDEARTLKAFWRLVQDFNPQQDQIIGHNIFDFDLLFLFKRSVIQRVQPSLRIPFRRYQQQPIYDTMWEWSCWHHRISLHNLATALGISSPKDLHLDGSKIYDYFREGRHAEISAYCMRDVECTREIYYRLNFLHTPPIVRYTDRIGLTPEVSPGKTVGASAM